MAEREKVKRILAGIVQRAPGGRLEGATRLFKAFYAAHLFYWRDSPGLLTKQAIVRMPRGPGIAGYAKLFKELETEGLLRIESQRKGPHEESVFVSVSEVSLDPAEEAAVVKGLAWVGDLNATAVSDLSHEASRTWRESGDGEPLAIYLDALSDLEVSEMQVRIDAAKAALDEHFSPH